MRSNYRGEIKRDRYGREIPKHGHGTQTLAGYTSSTAELMDAVLSIYDRAVNPKLLIRRITLSACRLLTESEAERARPCEQLDIFSVLADSEKNAEPAETVKEKEKKIQAAMLDIRKKYGKNAILKGTSLEEGATAKDRNGQIGGHRA